MKQRFLILTLAIALVLAFGVNAAAADYTIHLISPAIDTSGNIIKSGETVSTTINLQDSALPYALPPLSLPGHTFSGWFLMDGTTKATQLTKDNILAIASGDGYLFGYWDETQYPVVFNTNGGSPIAPIMAFQTTIKEPVAPTRNGSQFLGWFVDPDLTTPFDFVSQTVKKPLELYAKWDVQIAKLTFDLNYKGSNNIFYSQKPGSTLTPPSIPVRPGYSFDGWYSAAEEGSRVTVPTYMPDHNVTIYAHWNANNGTAYQVQHFCQELDGGYSDTPTEVENLTGDTDENVTAQVHEFAGFTEDTEAKDRVASGVIAPDGSTVLRLYYTRNSGSISFVESGGSDVEDITDLFGADITQPENPTRDKYMFDGWYSDAQLTTPYTFPATMPDGEITVYAKWVPEFVVVTFNYNYAEAPSGTVVKIKVKTPVMKPNNPIRNDYTFTGWYTDPAATKEFSFATKINDDLQLYAGWVKNAVKYADVPNSHWAKENISTMTEMGYFTGEIKEHKTYFYPERPMTRAEFVTILGRYDHVDTTKYKTSDYTFTDISSNVAGWAGSYIAWAAKNGIVSGKDTAGKIFDPNASVKRQEMAIIIGNYFKYKKVKLTGDFKTVTFSDKASIWTSAQSGVAFCVDTKLISGYKDGTFGPDRNMTRAEAATVLTRIVNYFVG